jgi:hypothetical protein
MSDETLKAERERPGVAVTGRPGQGASILNPRGAEADDEPAAVNAGRKWSDGELNGARDFAGR